MAVNRLWELVQGFKGECRSKGWKTSEHEDWVRMGSEYHNFLWTRTINPSTFKKIAEARKFAIRKGVSYEVVDVAYTAWLLSEPVTNELIETIIENPTIAQRTAVYDLSWLHSEKLICLKLNKTDSEVFREFEGFLEEKWGVKFKPVQEALTETL